MGICPIKTLVPIGNQRGGRRPTATAAAAAVADVYDDDRQKVRRKIYKSIGPKRRKLV